MAFTGDQNKNSDLSDAPQPSTSTRSFSEANLTTERFQEEEKNSHEDKETNYNEQDSNSPAHTKARALLDAFSKKANMRMPTYLLGVFNSLCSNIRPGREQKVHKMIDRVIADLNDDKDLEGREPFLTVVGKVLTLIGSSNPSQSINPRDIFGSDYDSDDFVSEEERKESVKKEKKIAYIEQPPGCDFKFVYDQQGNVEFVFGMDDEDDSIETKQLPKKEEVEVIPVLQLEKSDAEVEFERQFVCHASEDPDSEEDESIEQEPQPPETPEPPKPSAEQLLYEEHQLLLQRYHEEQMQQRRRERRQYQQQNFRQLQFQHQHYMRQQYERQSFQPPFEPLPYVPPPRQPHPTFYQQPQYYPPPYAQPTYYQPPPYNGGFQFPQYSGPNYHRPFYQEPRTNQYASCYEMDCQDYSMEQEFGGYNTNIDSEQEYYSSQMQYSARAQDSDRPIPRDQYCFLNETKQDK